MQTCSKIVLTLLAAACLAGCNQGQQNEKPDEKAIQKIIQAYQEAYNQQDAAKLAALWTSDAIYTNPVTNESAEGREAIENLFKKKFAESKKRHLEVVVKSIEFPTPDEAFENGVMKVIMSDQSAQQAAYQMRYVKENGKWMLDAISEIKLQEPFSNFEQLKDLAWLVGKWQDPDDNILIVFDNRWDKNRNFITQNFQMKIYGQDDIEGKQIIAWDPVKETVRSWVFDSDGGFGDGTWEKVDKSWYATMNYTLGDGRIGSSKNIYTPVDNNSYTFASIEREVDGEILPDLDPVTVEKVE